MIMPKKHITLSESYLGFGAFVIQALSTPMTVDECWKKVQKKYIENGKVSAKHSFDSFVLTLDLLFALNIINVNERGEVFNVHKKASC